MATAVETPTATDAQQNDENKSLGIVETTSDTHKRKASPETTAQDELGSPKRPRRDSHPNETSQPRPAPSAQDEKKRNKRLFGGLLSTLSQSSASNPAQKRRLEIDRRQHEKMRKEREEEERERRELGEKRREGRMREGIWWEEEVMRNRHKRMGAGAKLLKTRARPELYYLPTKRSAEQDDTINEQVQNTERIIQREEDEFDERRRKHEEKYGIPRTRRESREENAAMADAEPVDAPKEGTRVPDSREEENKTEVKPTIPAGVGKLESQADLDESGDEVMDAEEDMVIY